MRNLRFAIWIVVPVAVFLAYLKMGLPHFIWSYTWANNGTYDPFTARWYTRCTFAGPYGSFTTYPTNGRCDWLVFRKDHSGGTG